MEICLALVDVGKRVVLVLFFGPIFDDLVAEGQVERFL